MKLPRLHATVAWPPRWVAMLFLSLYVLVEAGAWLLDRVTRSLGDASGSSAEFGPIRIALLCGAAAVTTIIRVIRFHPASNLNYAVWLKLSPWTARKPLPLAPLHPVWQDIAVLAILTGLALWPSHVPPAYPTGAALMAYLSAMSVLLIICGLWRVCTALGILWPMLFLGQKYPGIAIVGLVGISAAAAYGHWLALRRFPWPFLKDRQFRLTPLLQSEIALGSFNADDRRAGWPYSVLSPKAPRPPITTRTSAVISLLVGWWMFCIMLASESRSGGGVLQTGVVIAAMLRLLLYLPGTAPPFTLISRLKYRTFIVPAYDRVFTTPIVAVLAGFAAGIFVRGAGNAALLVQCAASSVICFLLLNGGPTRRNWMLTGCFRIVPGGTMNSKAPIRRV